MSDLTSSSGPTKTFFGRRLAMTLAVLLLVVSLLCVHRWTTCPLFKEWKLRDSGYHRKMNILLDHQGHVLLFDRRYNMALLIFPDFGACGSMYFDSDVGHATVMCVDSVSWSVDREKDTLLLGLPNGEVVPFSITPGFVFAVLEVFPYAEGVLQQDTAEAVVDHYRGDGAEDLRRIICEARMSGTPSTRATSSQMAK